MTHLARQVWCEEHQKWGFTKNYARVVKRRIDDSDLQVYRCKGRWHLGHPPGPNLEDHRKEAS